MSEHNRQKTAEDILIFQPGAIDASNDPTLYFCETSDDVTALIYNAVCLSLTASVEDLQHCRDWLQKFEQVFILSKNKDFIENVKSHIFYKTIFATTSSSFGAYNTVKEVIDSGDRSARNQLFSQCVEYSPNGLYNYPDIPQTDYKNKKRTLSNFKELDYALGGFYESEVTVWTGKSGEGKSTFLGGVLLDAVDQGHKVCAYSGELDAEMFRDWILVQAAGPEWLDAYPDELTGDTEYVVKDEVIGKICSWLDKKMILVDNTVANARNENSILEAFRCANRIYGCDVFLLDNLMKVEMNDEREYYRMQSNFVSNVKEFSVQTKSHVHLVAHPRKTQPGKAIEDKSEISGSLGITNLADNAVAIAKVEDETEDCDSMITVLKSRRKGRSAKIGIMYDEKSKRFYPKGKTPNKRYGWDTREIMPEEYVQENDDILPF